MTNKNFPGGIAETGTGGNEFLFLSRIIDGKKTTDILMRAKKDGVEEVPNPDIAKGMCLPVYMKPLTTQIFTGMMHYFA